MSEQPPRASGQIPLPGESRLQREGRDIDPEAQVSARNAVPREDATREDAPRGDVPREVAPRGGAPQEDVSRESAAPGASSSSGAPRNPYGFPNLDVERGEVADPEERVRTRASEGLDRAADVARRLGHQARDQGGLAGRAEPIAYRVGDSLQSAASYVRAHDLYDMREDVEERVHRSPLKALALAAVGGFLLGRLIR